MYAEILRFWFEEIDQLQWWKKDDDFDNLIIERFSETHTLATHCELSKWRVNPKGKLAEIIVLDQFSRNIFRNSPLAFANDSLALALSQEAISAKVDKVLSSIELNFLYITASR